jgi:acetyl esterase/lipase
VSANYRLLPESNGLDILSDAKDVFKWVENELPAFLKTIGSDITPDYEKVAVYGESAGGYLAIQSGLMRPDLVKAVIGAYPVTYLDSPWYSEKSVTKAPFGAPQLPSAILDGHLASMSPGKIVTGAFPQDRIPFGIVALQQGRFPELLGTDESLYPAKVIAKKTSSDKAPFLYVFHGMDDSAVPASETEKFLGAWKEKFGDNSAIGKFEKGEHGFDGEASLETSWMKDGLVGVTKAWIG